jgi:hypothetical protein
MQEGEKSIKSFNPKYRIGNDSNRNSSTLYVVIILVVIFKITIASIPNLNVIILSLHISVIPRRFQGIG